MTTTKLTLGFATWLLVGSSIGALHYLTLWWNAQALTIGRLPLVAFAIQLARLAVFAAALAIISRNYGALPLLVATLGILASRRVALRLGAHA